MSPFEQLRQLGPQGVGLGLRWDFLDDVLDGPDLEVAFFEVSPENYMRRGGYYPAALEQVKDRYPIVTHGLTMSFGATDPPDPSYLAELRQETRRLGTPWHSDHLCFSTAGPVVLHDLLPIKHSRDNALGVADRVRAMQDKLGLPLAIENISYYAHPGHPEMPEIEFINTVLDASDCGLLLDVNNVYVNSLNHGFAAKDFLRQIPFERVIQIHVAGHERSGDLIIDTHGAAICDPVYELLEWTLEQTGPVAVLLERDHNIPPLDELLGEVAALKTLYTRTLGSA